MTEFKINLLSVLTLAAAAFSGFVSGGLYSMFCRMMKAGSAGGFCADLYTGVWYRTMLVSVILGTVTTIILCILLGRKVLEYRLYDIVEQNEKLIDRIRCTSRGIERIQNAYKSAEKTNKAKSKFMSRMSHDLRTPMNAIVGYSMLMEQSADEPGKVGYYTEKIILSSRALMELINDVLDMSSIEAGNVKLVKNNFSLDSAFEEVDAAIRPQSRSRGLNFNFYMNNETGVDMIVGDKQRLCQILRNLLSNAVKYTPEGGNVDLIVNVLNTNREEIHMLCQIKDTGCGISPQFLKRIFEPFEREDAGENVCSSGTGLGMPIAKSFVELMNGSIKVESKPGAGTLVTVKLPLIPVAKEESGPGHVIDNAELLKGIKFLAAEDNESNAEILYEVLSALGAECVVTGDGQEVVEVFEASAPDEFDIILLDIQMPVMNGYQAAATIRKSKHPAARDIAIVAMTADAFEEDVQRAFVCGMNGHVAKPMNLTRFISTVESLNVRRQADLKDKR